MSLWGWYIDPVYLMILVITLLISIGAQIMVSSAYRKWSAVKNSAGLTGGQVGQHIIQQTGLAGLMTRLMVVGGEMGKHVQPQHEAAQAEMAGAD